MQNRNQGQDTAERMEQGRTDPSGQGWRREKKSKPRKQGNVWNGGKQDRLWTGSILAALVAAAALFVAMLQMEKNMLSQYEKAAIYVTSCEIPEGMLLTQENWAQYLRQEELALTLTPETAVQEPEQIQDLVARIPLEKGVLLTTGMFETLSEVTKNMRQPVIASFKADDLYQTVSGVLRAGDRIHIYGGDAEGNVSLVYQNLFVQAVFDLSGNQITNEDHTTAVQRVNVYLDASEVEAFYTALSQSTLRVVKVCD